MVAINIDARQIAKLQRALKHIKDGVPKALAPAINRALDKGRTTVRREIRKVYLIKSKDIPITVKGANVGRLSGAITLRDGMLPLSKFKIVPSGYRRKTFKGGIFAQVKKGKGGNIKHGFWIPSGGPFVRRGSARLPLKRLLTISAPIMASQPTVGPAVNKAMGETLAKRIDHEMNRVLARGK